MADDEPPCESSTVTRVRDALTGGTRALGRDRDLAAYLASRFPRIGETVTAGFAFHRRAARWAVTEGGAAGVLFTVSGLPAPGRPLHAEAAEASPQARFCYADFDPKITEVNRSVLAEPGRVTVMTGPAAYPAALLALPQAAELLSLGPVCVHVIGALHYWAADLARDAITGYGNLLPAGSSLCLSWAVAGPELADMMTLAGGAVHQRTAGEVAGWLAGAGFALHGQGITDVRAFAAPFTEPPGPPLPLRVLGAAAVLP